MRASAHASTGLPAAAGVSCPHSLRSRLVYAVSLWSAGTSLYVAGLVSKRCGDLPADPERHPYGDGSSPMTEPWAKIPQETEVHTLNNPDWMRATKLVISGRVK